MPKKPPKTVESLRREERAYESSIRRFVLNPFMTILGNRFAQAEALRGVFISQLENDIADYNIDNVSDRIATDHIDSVRARHKRDTLSSFKRVLGVSVAGLLFDPAIKPIMDRRIITNVALIRSIPPQFGDELLRAVNRTVVENGFNQQALVQTLRTRFRVSRSRARLIARDQTSKTIGELTKLRQQQLGIRQYKWRTSQDERVRHDHAVLEGQVFSWDNPPDVGHPGEPIQCRCTAEAIIPDDF